MTTEATEQQANGIAWYARQELAGPWRIAACAAHGEELERHRFANVGTKVEGAGGQSREAVFCAVCQRPETLGEVARCTCEFDSARCPEHQNIGCGG